MKGRVPEIREEECIACGLCEEMCPEVFRFMESLGFAMVVNPAGASEEKIEEVMEACPSHCIQWSDELP